VRLVSGTVVPEEAGTVYVTGKIASGGGDIAVNGNLRSLNNGLIDSRGAGRGNITIDRINAINDAVKTSLSINAQGSVEIRDNVGFTNPVGGLTISSESSNASVSLQGFKGDRLNLSASGNITIDSPEFLETQLSANSRSGSRLQITANGDINLRKSSLQIGSVGDIQIETSNGNLILSNSTINAGRDVQILGQNLSISGDSATVGLSVLSSGRDLTIQSPEGDSLMLQDTVLNVGRDFRLDAPQSAINLQNLIQGTLSPSQIELRGDIGNFDGVNLRSRQALKIAADNLVVTNSNLLAEGDLKIQGKDTFYLGGSTLQSGNNIELMANGSNGFLSLADGERPLIVSSGGSLTIRGNSRVELFVKGNLQSVLRSVGDVTIISNGPIENEARLVSGGRIRFQDGDGTPYVPPSRNPNPDGGNGEGDPTNLPVIPPVILPVIPPVIPPEIPPVTALPEDPSPSAPEMSPVPLNTLVPTLPVLDDVRLSALPICSSQVRRSTLCVTTLKAITLQNLLQVRPESPATLPPQASR
jgi:hypothetical protein